ncbi:helix-turn-helix transcriptional regulator [Marinomonas pontica]|uniref:winged helix-turn-helix transcriptional regulator n=1 Tax=Marinomonas pontica TaxID=264739 RepID=UPI0022436F1B|nr:helix-turn-helix domain-containing protein [Marinomonas pontica]MCW8355495.1 helix-turn-helix transcriptional regulator [Marinomonas pontica]
MNQDKAPLAYSIYSKDCPARAFFDRLADHWTLLILGLLRNKVFRFNQIKREIEGISQKVLSQKLKQLERDGLVIRTAFATVPVTVEYRLTDLGHDFAQTIEQFAVWAEKNVGQVERAQKTYDEAAS